MMGFIKFLQKRPTDRTILLGKMLFGIIFITSLYYNLIVQGNTLSTEYFWNTLPTEHIITLKYIFISFGIVPILSGLFNYCMLRKKWVRIIQVFFGITLFYISSKIIPQDPNQLDVDSLIGFMGIFPFICGITGKCITTKCFKHGEKITKIRV